MKRLKLSLTALALMLTVGVSFATSSTSAAPNDCALDPFTPANQGTLDSDDITGDCPGDGQFCCYLVESDIIVEVRVP